jgi:hypothetical protein
MKIVETGGGEGSLVALEVAEPLRRIAGTPTGTDNQAPQEEQGP